MANLIRRGENAPSAMARASSFEPFRLVRDLFGWDPFREMAPFAWDERMAGYVPQFEVKETKDAYIFKADLPGIKESDLDISLTGNRLTVSGKREQEEKREDETYYAFERSYGVFTRSFTLPEGVDTENCTADLKDGVLTILVNKKPEAQPKRISLKPPAGKAEKAKA